MSFHVDEEEQAGQFGHMQMIYTENPMAAAVTVKKKDKTKKGGNTGGDSGPSSPASLANPSKAPQRKSLANSPASGGGTMANAVTVDDRKRASKASRKDKRDKKDSKEKKDKKEKKEKAEPT